MAVLLMCAAVRAELFAPLPKGVDVRMEEGECTLLISISDPPRAVWLTRALADLRRDVRSTGLVNDRHDRG